MSQGEDGAQERPASQNMPVAAPRPKPPVPGVAPPRPGAPGRVSPPPPLPTAATGTPAPARESNPFLPPESSRHVDDGWLVPDEAAEAEGDGASPDASANDPGAAMGMAAPAPTPLPPISPPPPMAKVEPSAPAPIVEVAAEPAKPQSVANLPSTPPPFKKGSRAKALAFMLLVAAGLVGGGVVYQSQMTTRSPTVERAPQPSAEATVEPHAPSSEPAPPPTYTAEPPPSAAAAKPKPAARGGGVAAAVSADPASQGILDTTQIPPGRKIMVDGRVVGTSPRKLAVRCGVHRIQIGDLLPESVAFPCGGEVSFTE